jgi:hypothetical protein
MDKKTKLSVVLGVIWGVVSVIFYFFIVGHGGITGRTLYFSEKLLLSPAYLADVGTSSVTMRFNWNLWIFLSVVFGVLILLSSRYITGIILSSVHRNKWRL